MGEEIIKSTTNYLENYWANMTLGVQRKTKEQRKEKNQLTKTNDLKCIVLGGRKERCCSWECSGSE